MNRVYLKIFLLLFVFFSENIAFGQSIVLEESSSELVINQDGNTGYSSVHKFHGEVLVINLKDYKLTTKITVGNRPFKPAIDEYRKKLYVVNHGSKNITIVDLQTYKTESLATGMINDGGYAITEQFLYIPHDRDAKITIIDLEKLKIAKVISLNEPIEGPLVLDEARNKLYVQHINGNLSIIKLAQQ